MIFWSAGIRLITSQCYLRSRLPLQKSIARVVFRRGFATEASSPAKSMPLPATPTKKRQRQTRLQPWRSGFMPAVFWRDPANRTMFLKSLASNLHFDYNDMESWYVITLDHVIQHGGGGLLAIYDDNLVNMLSTEFPGHEWIPWNFFRVPSNFWNSKSTRRQFFDWLSVRIGIEKLEDWYRVTRRQVRANGGSGLLMQMYQDSVARAVVDIFSEHKWQFWRFHKVPRGFWENVDHQREFLDFAAKELGIKTPQSHMMWEKWYLVSGKDLQALGGSRLINGLFKMNIANLVTQAYPEHRWIKWKFSRMGKHSWSDVSLQKEYLDWVFTTEHMKSPEDWYYMSKRRLLQLHGGSLLAQYDRSLYKALCSIYPNHEWDPVKFR